jgi:hypothetical protein
MTRTLFRVVSLLSLCAVPVLGQEVSPQPKAVGLGDLLVAPTRVVLQGRDRSAELTLVNTGETTATYRISFLNLRMNENGEMEEIQEPGEGERFADSLIRYSPRQVILEPRVAQTVRIQVRKPADLEAGEYRSHMLFRAVPDLSAVGGGVEGPETTEGLNIRLIPVYGVSIPIIVRHAETSASISMTDLQYHHPVNGASPTVSARILREGNRSVYGEFRARIQRTGEVVASIRGLGVYVPNASRVVTLPLQIAGDRTLAGETLELSFVDGETSEGRTLAKADLPIQ